MRGRLDYILEIYMFGLGILMIRLAFRHWERGPLLILLPTLCGGALLVMAVIGDFMSLPQSGELRLGSVVLLCVAGVLGLLWRLQRK
jgi:hypothetical protein